MTSQHSTLKLSTRDNVLVLKLSTTVLVLAVFSIIFRPDTETIHRPIAEDGYYSLSVARNIAQGNGITIDGTRLTNGFQPLFTFISVPSFLIARENKFNAIRLVLFLHVIFYCLAAYLLGRIAHQSFDSQVAPGKSRVFWWAVFLYVSSVLVFVVNFNGLETGLLLCLYAAAWRYYQITGIEEYPQVLLFGIILGVLILARIDALVLVVVVSFHELLSRDRPLSTRAVRSLSIAVMALLVSSPWWLFNYLSFGSWLPTSGRAYQSWMHVSALLDSSNLIRLREAFMAISRTTMPILYFGQNTFEGIGSVILRTGFLIGVILLLKRKVTASGDLLLMARGQAPILRRTIGFGIMLCCSMIMMIAWYTYSFAAVWFYTRYFVPLVLISFFAIAYLAVELHQSYPRTLTAVSLGMVVPLLTVVVFLHGGRFRSEFIDDQISLVQQQVPMDEGVAAFQTGTLGFFRDRVLNLDGKVNNEAVQHRADLLEYVQGKKVQWICDYEYSVEETMGKDKLRENGWRPVARRGHFALFWRDVNSIPNNPESR